MKNLKEIIDIEMLEGCYRKKIIEEDGRTYIPIDLMDKVILLEIYKMLSVIFEERENKGHNRQKKSK